MNYFPSLENAVPANHSIDQEFTDRAIVILTIDCCFFGIALVLWIVLEIVQCCSSRRREEEKMQLSEQDEDSHFLDIYFMNGVGIVRKVSPVGSSVCLALYRGFVFLFVLAYEIWNQVDWFAEQHDEPWINSLSHMTNIAFSLLILYYFLSFVSTLMFLICGNTECGRKCLPCCHHSIATMFSVVFVFAGMVVLAYWCVETPYRAVVLHDFGLVWQTFVVHFGNWVFLLIEWLMMDQFVPLCSSCGIATATFIAYVLWVTILVKSHLISEFPYHGIMSYDTNWWAIPLRYGLLIVFMALFLILLGCSHLKRYLMRRIHCDDDNTAYETIDEGRELEDLPNAGAYSAEGIISEYGVSPPTFGD